MPNHKWINFRLDLKRLPWQSWVQLGECVAKCGQLKAIPLTPAVKKQLHLVYLAKGVHATTAIEGNTLSEEQVRAVIEKKVTLPASKEYLEQEVNNIVEACNEIASDIQANSIAPLTIEKLCRYNEIVLQKNVPRDEVAVAGRIRSHNVVIGNVYRTPNASDAFALTQKFCDWMNSDDFIDNRMSLHFAIIKAVTAHLYLAWIHPFGDGNGRVARLLEFAILLSSGVPSPAAHVLSNHYNMTRGQYYSQLDRASKLSDPAGFFSYAIAGFRDGLDEQLQFVQHHVIDVCWRDYIYGVFRKHGSAATAKRRRELALRISTREDPIDKDGILLLMRHEYRNRTEKTLARDLNELERMQLIGRNKGQYTANKHLILQFRPFAASV
jgi:Fic family protein